MVAMEGKQTLGSSPRARGTRNAVFSAFRPCGIIPACAGNTGIKIRYTTLAGDHPRVRGEHMYVSVETVFVVGSSPRARGTRGRQHVHCGLAGIIPACAGNTP